MVICTVDNVIKTFWFRYFDKKVTCPKATEVQTLLRRSICFVLRLHDELISTMVAQFIQQIFGLRPTCTSLFAGELAMDQV